MMDDHARQLARELNDRLTRLGAQVHELADLTERGLAALDRQLGELRARVERLEQHLANAPPPRRIRLEDEWGREDE